MSPKDGAMDNLFLMAAAGFIMGYPAFFYWSYCFISLFLYELFDVYFRLVHSVSAVGFKDLKIANIGAGQY